MDVLGINRECGGKMHMSQRTGKDNATGFFDVHNFSHRVCFWVQRCAVFRLQHSGFIWWGCGKMRMYQCIRELPSTSLICAVYCCIASLDTDPAPLLAAADPHAAVPCVLMCCMALNMLNAA